MKVNNKSTDGVRKFKPRTITLQEIPMICIEGKDMLRDVITDYIIQNLYKHEDRKNSKKAQTGLITKKKYVPIKIDIEINGKVMAIQFDILVLLDKYIEFEKKSIYKQNSLEPLIIDILSFLDELQQNVKGFSIEIDENNIQSHVILNILIEKYHKDKQKEAMFFQCDEVRKKTIAKYKKVSFIQLNNGLEKKQCQFLIEKNQEENSQRVSRSTITNLQKQEFNKSNAKLLNRSKLKNLVDHCNVFNYPEKIDQLRRQKLINQFCKNEAEFIEVKQSCKENNSMGITNSQYSTDCMKLLDDWVNEINLSQKLFQRKYQIEKFKIPEDHSDSSSSNGD